MGALVRDKLTEELLIEEFGEAQEWIDDGAVLAAARQRMWAMRAALADVPEGFRVERVQGRPEPGRDPGAEYTVIDERRRPERLVGRVDRRLIGEQRVSWTGARLTTPDTMEAFAAVMRLAVADAQGRGRRG